MGQEMTPTAYLNESLNNLIKQITHMKCKAYNCQNEAKAPYYGCSVDHGYEIKTIPQQIKKAQDGYIQGLNFTTKVTWLDPFLGLSDYPVEAIIHYSLMV